MLHISDKSFDLGFTHCTGTDWVLNFSYPPRAIMHVSLSMHAQPGGRATGRLGGSAAGRPGRRGGGLAGDRLVGRDSILYDIVGK